MTLTDNTGQTLSVCFAISGLNTGGGIERHVRDLARGLVNADCSVTILAHESYRSLFENSIEFRTIRFDRWRFSPFLLREFTKHVLKVNPSIVHAHGRKAAQVVSLTRKKFPSRCVLTVHNLNIKSQLYENFDTIIAVSPAVARRVDHPHVQTILNGCS
ncbi:MAG: glycosyltransferase [Gammaproteobacteria bacterium]|nr:glycosyltransferase family 4 protein [Gammaproteobacteria bacterium]MXW08085.1 glycosyltransferase [Gammaproteobacteria bacterium]MYC25215.1 glycosyltransferase [Gammaproteobacteria bacterium]